MARTPRTRLSDEDLMLSPEVAWYLESRGIPRPTCPPKFKTPEASAYPGALFSPGRVDRVLAAFERMCHTQGKWAGRPLRPDPWNVAYILAPVYGWVRPAEGTLDGLARIVRTEYVDVSRKNGKTTLAGGQAIYLTAADGEDGAQVVAAAAGKDQAKFCFDPAKQICSKSPALSRNVRVLANRIVHPRTASYFQAVSALADLQHGANIHGGIIDELHVHKTRDLVDALETGTGAREQPLIIIITTPDDSRQGTIYDEKRTYCEQLARGVLSDPTFYGVIWGADDTDDPFAESTHRKANPGYGISPTKEFLESEARKARQSPANLARFKRLHLGIRTKQDSRYIDLPVWDRNAGRTLTEDILAGRPCYGGLDLGATSDLTALCWDFPDGQGGHDLLWRHWVPERAFIKLNERTAGQAALWREEGLLAVTPGDVADYDWIREQIRADRERFAVLGIGYDPWNATQIVNDLVSDGAPMVKVRQGFVTLTAPTKQLLHTLLEGSELAPRYRHGGNPLVRWQVDNLGVAMDASGNVKPDKAKSADKIDGLAAAVDALSLSMNYQPPKRSVYEDRGLTIA